MVDQATAKYLSDNIGGVLAKAMGEMAIAQPRDGVNYLSKWLQLYVEQEEARAVREQDVLKLMEERAKAQDRLSQQAARRRAREEEIQKKDATVRNFMQKLKDPETRFKEDFWGELLSVASILGAAKSAYLGLVDEEGLEGIGGRLIRYTEVLPGSEFMKDKVLLDGQGVTWGAVTLNPGEEVQHLWRPPLPEPVEPSGDDADAAPEPPNIPYLPVSVECVTDVQEVHYFDMTRLGAYLAVPLVYNSYYTAEAYSQCKEFEEARKKRLEELKAAEEAAEQARLQEGEGAADAADDEPPAADAEAEEEPQLVMTGKVVQMVLCLDTLGTNTSINEACFEHMMELCKAFGECKEETEKHLLDAQVLAAIDQPFHDELRIDIAAARTQAEDETAEQKQEEEATVPAEEERAREVFEKKWAWLRAQRIFLQLKEKFLLIKDWVFLTPETLSLIAATAFFFGFKRAEVYPKGKSALDWEVLRRILDDKFFASIQETDPIAQRKGIDEDNKLTAIKVLKDVFKLDEEKKEIPAPILEILKEVLDTAFEYRVAHLHLVKANYESRKAEVPEGEEFTEPPLEEGDDDFEGILAGL